MRPIPPKLRHELDQEQRMHACLFAGRYQLFGACTGRIEWEHPWIYGGRQINERWALVGVCHGHHKAKDGNRTIKDEIERTSLKLASKADLEKYPRKDWKQIKHSLGL